MRIDQIRVLNNVVKQTFKNNLKEAVAEAPKYINHVKQEVIYKKASDLNTWYTRILGLDEVKLYQDKVAELQDKLLNAQEQRRAFGQQLTEIRKKSNELQDQIFKVKRQDDLQRFLDLMKEETEILKLEMDVNNKFNECDREEREVFTAFTNAVRDCHQKQRAQLEYTKYFGVVLSVIGSFLTFCFSSLRKQDLKLFVEQQLQTNQESLKNFAKDIDRRNLELTNSINGTHSKFMTMLQSTLSSVSNAEDTNSKNKNASNFNVSSTSHSQKLIIGGCLALISLVVLRSFSS